MKIILGSIILLSLITVTQKRIDFGSQKDKSWGVINDGVMGGMSKGTVSYTKESVKLSGFISLANNGGFSSLKGPFQANDLSTFKEVTIRYRSEGIAFAMTLETDRRWFIPYFKHPLKSTSKEWTEITFPIKDFKKYNIGRATGEKISQEDLSKILRIGFISNEKQESNFNFEVDFVEFK